MNIKIGEQIFPLEGLTTDPLTPEDELRLVGDVQPAAALLLGKGVNGAVWLEATPTGELKTADAGGGITSVVIAAGNAADSATDLALSASYTKLSIEVNDFSVDLAFETSAAAYTGDLVLKVGYWEFDISGVDVRLNNTVSGETCAYKVWAWA